MIWIKHLALCLALAAGAAYGSAPWTIEAVDTSGHAGLHASLALDAGGGLHLCYYDSLHGDLLYARRSEGAWSYQTVDTAGDVGRFCSMVAGPDDLPRVSYFDSTNRSLKYAAYDGASWTLETADPGPGVGQFTSICLLGTAALISYYDQANRDLKLATRTTSWALAKIDTAGNVGRFTSVANSGNNQTRIAYYSDTLKQIKFARQQGSNFILESPDPSINTGTYASLALRVDVPTIAYFDSAGGRIRRAVKPASWVVDTADNSGTAGGHISLAFNHAGNPVVSYFDATNGDLRLARHSGTAWTTEAVDTAGTVGLYTSCRVRSDSAVYIAYFDQTRGWLKLARTADTVPPGPPQGLTANGSSPSPWGRQAGFGLDWTNPADESGIARSLYKLGSAPSSDYDTTGSLAGVSPDTAFATETGGQPLHLWLVDGAGNTSHQNVAMVLLRRDTIPPSGSAASSPEVSATAVFDVSWSAGSDSGGSGLSGRYSVMVRDGSGPWTVWLFDTAALSAPYSGADGHRYFFEAAAGDSAGNSEAFASVAECSTYVDASLPAVASIGLWPDTVRQGGFTVLTGRITDNVRVNGAEYFVDAVGAPGTGIPATPVDSFGQASVDLRDTILTLALADGSHWIFLRGRDDAGQWGPFDSASFHKEAEDLTPPSFAIQLSPPSPAVGSLLSIYAVPSEALHPDSSAVCTLRTPDGTLRPVSLSPDPAGLRGGLSTAGFPPGDCRLTVAGYDLWSNRGSSFLDFALSASGEFLPEGLVYVWPNPARGDMVHFHYYVNVNAEVTAEVFALDGRRVARLTGRGQGGKPPHRTDSNTIDWDIAGTASDVYLLRLTAEAENGGEKSTVVKKFAIVR